ncbi:MAG: PEP-CTERM sorting domain-containing protein [Verrucomicrobiales bacterium]|nr:PEP-CTERM sorting domain-containing protein [Verrucomicrobiales bacterium]
MIKNLFPEPSTLMLLGLGAVAPGLLRWRGKR